MRRIFLIFLGVIFMFNNAMAGYHGFFTLHEEDQEKNLQTYKRVDHFIDKYFDIKSNKTWGDYINNYAHVYANRNSTIWEDYLSEPAKTTTDIEKGISLLVSNNISLPEFERKELLNAYKFLLKIISSGVEKDPKFKSQVLKIDI